EPHSRLNEPPREQAALAELAAIAIAEGSGLFIELKNLLELRPGQAQSFADGCVVVFHQRGIGLRGELALADGSEQFFPAGLARFGNFGWAREAVGTGFGVGQVDVVRAGTEKTGSAGDIGI